MGATLSFLYLHPSFHSQNICNEKFRKLYGFFFKELIKQVVNYFYMKKDIISMLRKNSRISFAKLARNLHVPITTLYYQISNLEKNQIKAYKTLLDFESIGYFRTQFFLSRKAKKSDIENILKESINNWSVTPDYHLIECVFLSKDELDVIEKQLLEKNILKIKTPILKIIKQESARI